MLKYKYSFLYCVATGIANVCIDGMADYMPISYVLCLSCLIAIIYFNLTAKDRLLHIYRSIWQHKLSFLVVNIIVGIMWACTFYGVAIGGATYYNLIYFTSAGFFALILSDSKSHIIQISLLILIIALTYFVQPSLIGFILAILGGLSGYVYSKISKGLHDELGFTANEMLAVRFWLLFIVLIVITPKEDFIIHTNLHNIIIIIIVALLSMVVQLWLAQQGVIHSGVQMNQYIMTLTPAAVFFAQGLILNEWHPILLILTLLVPLVLFGKNIFERKKEI